MNKYTFHEDPGHGWLEVPRADLVAVGLEGKISSFSYQKDDKVYLEEDCDMSAFLTAWEACNRSTFSFAQNATRVHYNSDAPIRAMKCYRGQP